MKRLTNYIIVLLVLSCLMTVAAMKRSLMFVKHGHKIVLIDLRSDKDQINQLLQDANITGLSAAMLVDSPTLPDNNFGWHLSRIKSNLIQIEMALPQQEESSYSKLLTIIDNILQTGGRPGYPADVACGVNNFARITVRELPSGSTRFFFPGSTNARRVQLSGSFNNWTTSKGLMLKTDSGWISDIKLDPGPYAYKYIVDGHWTLDNTNNLKENDGWSGYNSVYFRYNYTFKLPGYTSARRVVVAGDFNKWNANQLIMTFKGDHWEKPLYLHEGTHLYRFMVDGRWVSDPANKTVAKRGNDVSSVLSLGESASFKLMGYTDARNVFVAGSFNNWNPEATRMQRTTNGWALPYTLAAGNYTYKFVVDGNWMADPANPHTLKTDETNSFIAVKPNYTFVLRGYNSARSVRLSGTFNNWNKSGYTMQHTGDEWRISLNLKPGKHLYKFIVDGQWIIDPGNKLWEQNEHNTGNSVLWMGN